MAEVRTNKDGNATPLQKSQATEGISMGIEDLLDRRVPLAVAVAIVLQAGTVIWWAATKDTDSRFQEQRVSHLEDSVAQTKQGQTQILERLARIEERVSADGRVLDRIEKHIGAARR